MSLERSVTIPSWERFIFIRRRRRPSNVSAAVSPEI